MNLLSGLGDLAAEGLAWSRLAYDEMLASQLALALVRAHARRQGGHRNIGDGSKRARITDALPYSLTPSQRRAVVELVADPEAPGNVHEIEVEGSAGRFTIQLQGKPSRTNPKTSALAALSVARALINLEASIVI